MDISKKIIFLLFLLILLLFTTSVSASITIDSPENSTYYGFYQLDVGLNVTQTVTGGTIGSWWYNVNGTNETFTPNKTISVKFGEHSLTVYMNWTNGTEQNANVDFEFTEGYSYENEYYFYVILLIVPLILVILSKMTDDLWFRLLAGFSLLPFSLYIIQQSTFPNFTSDYIRLVLFFTIVGIAFYLIGKSGYDLIQESG